MPEEFKVYVEQAPGFKIKGKEDYVCQILKGLYGLPPSGKLAQDKLVEVMTEKCHFKKLVSEPMLFRRVEEKKDAPTKFVNIGFHVDDGLAITNDEKGLFSEMKLALDAGNLKCKVIKKPTKFLGLNYDFGEGMVLIHQEGNVRQLIHSIGLDNAKPYFTPCDPNFREEEEKDEELQLPTDKAEYQSICGQLIWLLQTHYNCYFAINNLCKKMSDPNAGDFLRAKRLCRFFIGRKRQGLRYRRALPSSSRAPETYAYCDSGLNLKPVSGVAVFIGEPDYENHNNRNAAVMCQSKSENIAVGSTMHAEMLAIGRAIVACEAVCNLRYELGFPQPGPSIIFTDSQPAIRFITGTGSNPGRMTRHLRLRLEYVMQAIRFGRVRLLWVSSANNCADILTKPLGKVLFEKHSKNLMGTV